MATDAANPLRHLAFAPGNTETLARLAPPVAQWFRERFETPTLPQRLAWPVVQGGDNLLLAAPTGTGKTLAAFLPILERILQTPPKGLQCLYVAPLKALIRDARKNLRRHLRELQRFLPPGREPVSVGLRTGETSFRVRRQQLETPPEILLTTPESLAILLSQRTASDLFRTLRWIVVDEVHALAACKRGADLALALERVEVLNEQAPQRIGLSATCAPLATAARFVAGSDRPCTIAEVPDTAPLELTIEPLGEDARQGFLARLVQRLAPIVENQRTTLVFTNTRNLAERLTWALRRKYPDWVEQIGVHHSSLAATRRRSVERRLKQGRLRIAVSSTSLELGIDIGSVDSVVLVHPPGGVVRLLQRIGRAGHRPGQPRLGLVLTASPAELLEATVTAASGRLRQIEPLRIPDRPLDVLCQHLAGMAMSGSWPVDEAFALARRAYPFRELTEEDFADCLAYLAGKDAAGNEWLPPRIVLDECRGVSPTCPHASEFTIAGDRTARLLRRNLGTILAEELRTIELLRGPADEWGPRTVTLGEVDDQFAQRLQPGDRFLLEGRCLEYRRQQGKTLLVEEVMGRPLATSWLGAGWPVSSELARRVYHFRTEAAEALREGTLGNLLRDDYRLGHDAADELAELFRSQERVSEIPEVGTLLIEIVPGPALQYYVHTPLTRAGNDALVRVAGWRLRRQRGVGVTSLAADLGFLLCVHDAQCLAPDAWRTLLGRDSFDSDLAAALADCPSLREHFGRVATTGLMVLRSPNGGRRRVGGRDWAERRLFDHVRAAQPGFVLLRQAAQEQRALCADDDARAFVDMLPRMMVRCRTLRETSPLAKCWAQMDFAAVHAGDPQTVGAGVGDAG